MSEIKVMDPVSGWAEIRPYCATTWKFLRAAFRCPLLLLSATMEDNSLSRILGKIYYYLILITQNISRGKMELGKNLGLVWFVAWTRGPFDCRG